MLSLALISALSCGAEPEGVSTITVTLVERPQASHRGVSAWRLGPDARLLVTLRVDAIEGAELPFPVGSTQRFLVHSVARVFRDTPTVGSRWRLDVRSRREGTTVVPVGLELHVEPR